MKPIAFIPLIFLAITYSAQAAPASYKQYPTTPPETHFLGSCDSDPDGTKFAAKACYTKFKNPGESGYAPRYRPPTCDKSKQLSQEQKAMLAKAYSRAPDYMKGKLCRLTQLFVTRSQWWGPMGWGFWEGPDRLPGSKSVYVAISDRQLTGKKSFIDVENQTISGLLRAESHNRAKDLIRLKTGVALEPELAVLSELSHELGHALVADANMDGIKPDHPRRKVSGPPKSTCFESAFIQASWDDKQLSLPRWVDFSQQYGNMAKNPDLRFSLQRLQRDARQGKADDANRVITNIYSSKEFVGLAAAINPVEDAVETYKYKVLYDVMGNQKAGFDVNGRAINVFDNLDSGVLQKKVQCLSDFGFFSGQP